MQFDKETLNIGNICGGAVPEVFAHAVEEVFKNVKDINTSSDQQRSIVLEFKFEIFKDRSGAEVTFACKSKLAGVSPVVGTVFAVGSKDRLSVYAKDPRQDALFTEPAAGGVS